MKVHISKAQAAILELLREVKPELISDTTDYTRVVIPTQQAWGTYKIRYNIKLEKNTIVAQDLYEKTLNRLEQFGEELVAIHAFSNDKDFIIIFSDATESKIIGYILG
jgi:hypothetical protein